MIVYQVVQFLRTIIVRLQTTSPRALASWRLCVKQNIVEDNLNSAVFSVILKSVRKYQSHFLPGVIEYVYC